MFVTTLPIALLFAVAAPAQEIVQPLPGTTDADALAADMRRLGANPRDVDALVDAATLSLRLGDMRAAAALLARAENVDPRNARAKAGQASILVQSERPGEALRYFAQAEAWGLDSRAFAADRGLAYDLTGEQERAQRDYRTALRDHPADEETIRRYALSLGISGQRERALALLDPLVRRSDRGAWRSQAFILAMTGDVGGASRIAATMMPGGAAGLSAFFERLPTLPPIDRAFAVHFGEVRTSPERLADARLAPALTPLAREPGVALAANTPAPVVLRRDRRGRETPRGPVVSTPTPGFTSTRDAAPVTIVAAAPTSTAQTARTPSSFQTAPRPGFTTPPAPAMPSPATRDRSAVATVSTRPTSPPPTSPPPTTVAAMDARPAIAASLPPQTSLAATPTEMRVVDAPPSPAPATPVVLTAVEPRAASPVAVSPAAQPRAVAPAPRAVSRMSEDSILARIVAGLSIPAAELGVAAPVRAAPEPAPEPAAPVAVAQVEPTPDPAIAARAEADRLAEDRRVAAKAAADKRAADRKAVADRKALAEKKAAAAAKALADKEVAAAKALADKEAAAAKKLARANPERIWVQVAGGAYEGDLPKAYGAVKAKAPAVFGARGGWTTPLRATNRVLTGPFKTDAEARAFVNDLRKEGVSAFTFTSEAGQPIKRLGAKDAAPDEDEAPARVAPKKKATRRR